MKQKAEAFDIEEFFGALPKLRVPGKLDAWLEEDPERAKRFWAIMDLAYKRNRVGAAVKLWNQRYDEIPVRGNQIRVRLNERHQSR